MLFRVYLLIQKRAVLRKTIACWRVAPDRKASELPSRVNSVSLLANRGVLYHKVCLISNELLKNVRDTALTTGDEGRGTMEEGRKAVLVNW